MDHCEQQLVNGCNGNVVVVGHKETSNSSPVQHAPHSNINIDIISSSPVSSSNTPDPMDAKSSSNEGSKIELSYRN